MCDELIMTVDEVSVDFTHESRRQVRVIAVGTVSTGGWTSPRLVAVEATAADDPGIDDWLTVEFRASRPEGMAMQVLSTITAESEFAVGESFVGMRLKGRDNQIHWRPGDSSEA